MITHWHWLILGTVLLVAEMLVATGSYLLWMAVAAGVVGLMLYLVPALGVEYQLIAFTLVAVGLVLVSRRYFRRNPITTTQPTLNRRGSQYVGRVFSLAEPIVNGQGKIRVDDTTWKIEGDDMPVGQQIKVVGVDGTILKVTAVVTTAKSDPVAPTN